MTNPSSVRKEAGSAWIDILKFIAAFGAIFAFGLFVYYMLGNTKAEDKEWTRAAYLFQGVEAVAFAAAGFLFGREVHRERAENAEKRANEKEQAAANGEALAKLVKSKATNHPARVTRLTAATVTPETVATADLDDLAATANQLFP